MAKTCRTLEGDKLYTICHNAYGGTGNKWQN